MEIFLAICGAVTAMGMLALVVLYDSIEERLARLTRQLEQPSWNRTRQMRLPWESDGSNFNLARPGPPGHHETTDGM
jgi:hypothetical protein